MTHKHWAGVGVLAAVILLLGILFPRPGYVSESYIAQLVKEAVERLGAIPGTSVDSNFFSIGGVEKAHFNQALTSTSSVLCAVQNPFRPATSTIDRITVKRTTGFVGASQFDISTSTTQFASSTVALVKDKTVAAGNQDTTLWTPRFGTSTSALHWAENVKDSPFILKGVEWITVRNATGSAGSETIRGACNFDFTKF